MDDAVNTFISITASTPAVAQRYITLANGDASQAVGLFFENPDLATEAAPRDDVAISARRPDASGALAPQRSTTGRQDGNGVIHLDSDEELDDFNDADLSSIEDFDDHPGATSAASARNVARNAQEDEDAAIARRMQEELYADKNPADADGVRAPMARTTETLVAPSGRYGVDDDEDDTNARLLEQMRRRAQPRPLGGNPFSQSIWDNSEGSTGNNNTPPTNDGASQTRAQRLAELFRPPLDLISPLSWYDAREEGKQDKKWILVNLQDMADFHCQALNRDHWKDPAIVELVRENFLFLQYSTNDPHARDYQNLYMPGMQAQNPHNFPHVAVIDPRTGEQVKVWSGAPFPDAGEFHSDLVEFLDRYSLDAKSKNPVSKKKRPAERVDVDRLTEDEQLRLAMANSLGEENGGEGGDGHDVSDVLDPDELTRSTNFGTAGSSETLGTTGNTPVIAGTPTPEAAASVFSTIAGDKPHTEPAHDPATTTRIQFRHASGRIIRRFALVDGVQILYEWLKAEPLEGRSAADEFELKVVPEGRDLIDELDKTVEEAGLKQATVMIEYA